MVPGVALLTANSVTSLQLPSMVAYHPNASNQWRPLSDRLRLLLVVIGKLYFHLPLSKCHAHPHPICSTCNWIKACAWKIPQRISFAVNNIWLPLILFDKNMLRKRRKETAGLIQVHQQEWKQQHYNDALVQWANSVVKSVHVTVENGIMTNDCTYPWNVNYKQTMHKAVTFPLKSIWLS